MKQTFLTDGYYSYKNWCLLLDISFSTHYFLMKLTFKESEIFHLKVEVEKNKRNSVTK